MIKINERYSIEFVDTDIVLTNKEETVAVYDHLMGSLDINKDHFSDHDSYKALFRYLDHVRSMDPYMVEHMPDYVLDCLITGKELITADDIWKVSSNGYRHELYCMDQLVMWIDRGVAWIDPLHYTGVVWIDPLYYVYAGKVVELLLRNGVTVMHIDVTFNKERS